MLHTQTMERTCYQHGRSQAESKYESISKVIPRLMIMTHTHSRLFLWNHLRNGKKHIHKWPLQRHLDLTLYMSSYRERPEWHSHDYHCWLALWRNSLNKTGYGFSHLNLCFPSVCPTIWEIPRWIVVTPPPKNGQPLRPHQHMDGEPPQELDLSKGEKWPEQPNF